MNRELLQQALDMINTAISSGDWKVDGACDPDSLIRRLKAELALDRKADNARELGLDYEPVLCGCGDGIVADSGALCGICASLKPIREWVGLTNEELEEIQYSTDTQVEYITYDEGEYGMEIEIHPENFARAIEAKLKEKNHGSV